jgi:hypothetical protein
MATAAALTEMKAGIAPAKAVADGVTKINRIVGVNINSVASVDATNSTTLKAANTDAQQYALYNAAFADVVGAGNVQTVLDTYYQEFADGDFDAGNNLKSLLTNVQKQADAVIYKDSLSQTAKNDITQSVTLISADIKTDGSYTPAPSDNTNLTEVEKAKSLVQETRNWVTSLSQLDSPAQAFNVEAQAVKENLGTESQAVLEESLSIISEAFSQIGSLKKDGKAIPSTLTINNAVFNVSLQESPTAKLTISNPNYLGINLNYTITLDKPLSEIINADSTSVLGKTYSGTLNGSSVKNNITTKLDTSLSLTNGSALTVENYVPITSLALNGTLSSANANGNNISGSVTLEATSLDADKIAAWKINKNETNTYQTNNSNLNSLSLSRFKLDNVSISTASGNSAGLGINIKIDNAAKFDSMAYLQGYPDRIWVAKCFSSDVVKFAELAKKYGIIKLDFGYYAPNTSAIGSSQSTYFSGTDINGQNLSFYNNDVPSSALDYIKEAYLPDPFNWIESINSQFIDYYPMDSACPTWAGANITLNTTENATNFIDGSVTITGKMALKGYPEATASVLFDRNAYDSATASIALAYNSKTLTINVSGNTQEDGQLTVKSPADDTKLMVNIVKGQLTGNITVDTKVVGTISNSGNAAIIRYTDGSMESL